MRYSGGRTARRTSAHIATGALVAGGLLLVSAPGAQAHPVDVTFTTPGAASWTVPSGVTTVSVLVSGAQGGGSNSGLTGDGTGGLGATVSAVLGVTPGQDLSLTVGGTSAGLSGGIGGGGAGGSATHAGAGGGGASAIKVSGTTWVVAGGGGGAAYGVAGGSSSHAGGYTRRTQDGTGGGQGTQTAGGPAGTGGSTATIDFATCTSMKLTGPSGHDGAAGVGGAGGARDETAETTTAAGGGGGGGYYGGGGGGGGAYCLASGPDSFGVGGGGGGGSSFVQSAVATSQKVTEGAQAGNGSITISYVDTGAPVGAPVQTPKPNAAGWNNTPVAVAWNWTDAVSGVDPGNCVQTSSTDTRTGAVLLESTCADLAGNTSSASVTVNVDTGAPAAAPALGATLTDGWSDRPVDVTWHWSDAVSGVDPTRCPASSSESREGVRQLTATCTDLAGNTTTASETVRIDRTAPAIKVRRPIQGTYHRKQVVIARYRCRDAGAGIASCRGSVASGKAIPTRKLGKHTFLVTAVDRVGHTRTVRLTYRVVR